MKYSAFLVVSFLALNHSYAATDYTFQKMKCDSLLSNIAENIPPYANTAKSFNSKNPYAHIKAIASKLGDINSKNITDQDFLEDLEMAKTELKSQGMTDSLLDITRVERYEINGRKLDVFVLPDGVVHHISNPLSNDGQLVSVKNCKIDEREIGCINPITNQRDSKFCEVNKPEQAKEFSPKCDEETVNEYIAEHNCLLQPTAESCRSFSATAKGSLGVLGGGLAGVLLRSKNSDIMNRLAKIETMQPEYIELQKRILLLEKEAAEESKAERIKLVEEIKKERALRIHEKWANKNYPKKSREIDKFVAKQLYNHLDEFIRDPQPRSLNYRADYQYTYSSEQEAFDKLQEHYQKSIVDKVFSKLQKLDNPLTKYISSPSNLEGLLYPIHKKLKLKGEAGLADNNLRADGFYELAGDKTLKAIEALDKTAKKMALADYFKKNPADKKAYEKFDFDESRGSYVRDIVDSKIRDLELHHRQQLLKNKSPEFKFFYEVSTNYATNNAIAIAKKYNFSPKNITAKKNMQRIGVLSALGGAATLAALSEKNRQELKSCQKELGLDDEDISFLNNEGIFLAGSQVKKPSLFSDCSSMFVEAPAETIANARERFGAIPKGLCKIITTEKDKLDKALKANFQELNGSCESQKIETKTLKLFENDSGKLMSEFFISRPEGNFVYTAPLTAGNTFPDMRSVQVFQVDPKGERILDKKYTQDFKDFYNQYLGQGNTLDLSRPLTAEEEQNGVDLQKIKEERNNKYNAYMTQTMRSYVDSCKGYGTIECEVFEKAINVAPVLAVTKAYCGENVFDNKKTISGKKSDNTITK